MSAEFNLHPQVAFKRIAAMGLELEGGWDTNPADLHYDAGRFTGTPHDPGFPRGNIGYDGSITDGLGNYTREVTSPVLEDMGAALKFLKAYYPPHVDKSCGFHIHLSFKRKADYQRIMNKRFFRYVLLSLYRWGAYNNIKNDQFWSRLKGEGHYCKRKYMPERQVHEKGKGSQRYAALNYCYARYTTVELRVLPMFKEARIAALAMQFYVSLVERYLEADRKGKHKEKPFEFIATPAELQREGERELFGPWGRPAIVGDVVETVEALPDVEHLEEVIECV